MSFSLGAGEVFGLLGPDGAGKTTLMRILCGLISPDRGRATVAGRDVVAHPEAAKPHLGYLAQRFSLYADLTVAENVAFTAALFGVPRQAYAERLDELLEITRLAPFTGRLAGQLSGGMRQKLALMCCLIHRPQVLLLDEPTTGVDPASRRDFWRLLHALPEEGVTVLVSTPYMDEAERCDRVALLHRGRLLACDTPESLKGRAPGRLFALIATPQATARRALEALPEVRAVTVFGDRLHVMVEESEPADRLEATVRESGGTVSQVEPIEPGLEDAFAALVTEEGGRD